MKLQIVSIRDIKTDSYSNPQFVVSIPGWVRALSDEVNKRDGNPLAAHPEDYEAWHLGEWDDNNANFETDEGETTEPRRKQIVAISNLVKTPN